MDQEKAACKTCKELKPLDLKHFRKNHNNGKPMPTTCKECYNKSRREFDRKRASQPKRVEARKQYKLNNPEKIKELNKKWREENKEYNRSYMRGWLKKRYHSHYKHDPRFRIDNAMGANINSALKGNKAGRKWESLVGYTVEDLIKHLESKFENWMTWENYGNPNGDHTECWHVDHIVPQSSFEYTHPEEESFKRCWELDNLQPLSGKENIRKGNKYCI